jgi:hypothetical protein
LAEVSLPVAASYHRRCNGGYQGKGARVADLVRTLLVALVVLLASWGVLVALALGYAARQVPREVLYAAWPAAPRLLARLIGDQVPASD